MEKIPRAFFTGPGCLASGPICCYSPRPGDAKEPECGVTGTESRCRNRSWKAEHRTGASEKLDRTRETEEIASYLERINNIS